MDEMEDESTARVLCPENTSVSYLDLRGLNEEEKERIRKVVQRDKVIVIIKTYASQFFST